MVLKELIFNSFYFGRCGGLERMIFNSFFILERLILTVSTFGGCGGLERTDL